MRAVDMQLLHSLHEKCDRVPNWDFLRSLIKTES
jgi:hypothetical protein